MKDHNLKEWLDISEIVPIYAPALQISDNFEYICDQIIGIKIFLPITFHL